MDLSITINFTSGSPVFELADLESGLCIPNLKILPLTEELKQTKFIAGLYKLDKEQILSKLSKNQLTITLYFFLKNNIPSHEIVQKWLSEAGCEPQISRATANLIYEAVVESYEDNETQHFRDTILNDLVIESDNISAISQSSFTDVNEILDELRKGLSITWQFDQFFKSQSQSDLSINISKLRELLFQIEDHSSIIIGFANTIGSMIELLSAYHLNYLDKLCRLIPMGFRDLYSVGSCLITFPELKSEILSPVIREIEFYGLDSNGILRKYSKNQNYLFYRANFKPEEKSDLIESNNFLPLFLKLLK